MASGKGRKSARSPQPAAAANSRGFLWPWVWPLLYAAGAALGLLVAFVAWCVVRSRWCYKRKSGKQQACATKGKPSKDADATPVRLYWAEVSQDSHIVHCCLQEKGVAFDKVALDAGHFGKYEHLRADILAMCPNGTLPFIVHDDCPVIGTYFEVIDYIDQAFEGPPLVPRDSDRLKELEAMLQIICEQVGRPVAMLCRPCSVVFQKYMSLPGVLGALWRHPNPAVYLNQLFSLLMGFNNSMSQDFAVQSFKSLNLALDTLEKRFEDGRDYLLGSFSVVDIALMAEFARLDQLGLLDMLLDDAARQAAREGRGRVRAYWERLRARKSFEPSFRQASGAGARELRDWFARFAEDIRERGPVAVYMDGPAAEDEDEEET